MDATVLDSVHAYWFGDLKAWDGQVDDERRTAWFRPTPEIDTHIRDTWGANTVAARDAAWDLAVLTRRQQVALVVLLDQFPRQIHRDSGEAFACDAAALAIARRLVVHWRRFFVAEQTFVMLPFEHSEDVAAQDMSVKLYADRALEAPPDHLEACRDQLDYATRHRDIIRKFGRFPHRNAVLGRESNSGGDRVPQGRPGVLVRDRDVAELDHRFDVGVVRHVALQESGVRAEGRHEVLGRVEQVLAHRHKGRWCAGRPAADAAVHRDAPIALAGGKPLD